MEFRPTRLLLALTLGASICAIPMLDMALYSDSEPSKLYLLIIPVILGTSWLLCLAGVAAIGLRKRKRPVRRLEFQVVGAAIAVLLPLTAMITVQVGARVLFPDLASSKRAIVTPVMPLLLIGLIETPFGLLAAWIFWRLGFPSLTVPFAEELSFCSHRWVHLRRNRLFVSLLLAPTPAAIVVSGVCIALPYTDIFAGLPWPFTQASFGWIWSITGALAMLGGVLFFGALARLQEWITRGNCLLFGAASAFLLPGIWAVLDAANRHFISGDHTVVELFLGGSVVSNTTTFCMFGTLLVPSGLLGGWLLWQVGVAPSPNPAPIALAEAAFD